jgi:hypothetical protein
MGKPSVALDHPAPKTALKNPRKKSPSELEHGTHPGEKSVLSMPGILITLLTI